MFFKQLINYSLLFYNIYKKLVLIKFMETELKIVLVGDSGIIFINKKLNNKGLEKLALPKDMLKMNLRLIIQQQLVHHFY